MIQEIIEIMMTEEIAGFSRTGHVGTGTIAEINTKKYVNNGLKRENVQIEDVRWFILKNAEFIMNREYATGKIVGISIQTK